MPRPGIHRPSSPQAKPDAVFDFVSDDDRPLSELESSKKSRKLKKYNVTPNKVAGMTDALTSMTIKTGETPQKQDVKAAKATPKTALAIDDTKQATPAAPAKPPAVTEAAPPPAKELGLDKAGAATGTNKRSADDDLSSSKKRQKKVEPAATDTPVKDAKPTKAQAAPRPPQTAAGSGTSSADKTMIPAVVRKEIEEATTKGSAERPHMPTTSEETKKNALASPPAANVTSTTDAAATPQHKLEKPVPREDETIIVLSSDDDEPSPKTKTIIKPIVPLVQVKKEPGTGDADGDSTGAATAAEEAADQVQAADSTATSDVATAADSTAANDAAKAADSTTPADIIEAATTTTSKSVHSAPETNAGPTDDESDYTDLDEDRSIPDGDSEYNTDEMDEMIEAMEEGDRRFGPKAATSQQRDHGQTKAQAKQDVDIADVTGHIAEPSADNAVQDGNGNADNTSHSSGQQTDDSSSESGDSSSDTSARTAHSPLQTTHFSISAVQRENDFQLFVNQLQQIHHRQTELIHALVYGSVDASDRDVQRAMRVLHLISSEVIDAVQQSSPQDPTPVAPDTARKLLKLLPASPADTPAEAGQDGTIAHDALAAVTSPRKYVNVTDGEASGVANISAQQDTQRCSESEMLDVSLEVAPNDDELVAKGIANGLFGEAKPPKQAARLLDKPGTSQQVDAKPEQAARIHHIRSALKRSLACDATQPAHKQPRKADNFPPDNALVRRITGREPSHYARLMGDLAWRKLLATHAFDKACHNYRPLGRAQQPSIELATAAFQLFYIYCGPGAGTWRRHAPQQQ